MYMYETDPDALGFQLCELIRLDDDDGTYECETVAAGTACPQFETCAGQDIGSCSAWDGTTCVPGRDVWDGTTCVPPGVLCDAAFLAANPEQVSCTTFDIDGDGVRDAFPDWIAQPITVTKPSGAMAGDSMTVDLLNADGSTYQTISIIIPEFLHQVYTDVEDLHLLPTFEYSLLTRDCLVFCEADSKQAECCASFFGDSSITGGGEADGWGRWPGNPGSNRIYNTMRPLPEILSLAGAATATCIDNDCTREWYWSGLFEPPTPGPTSYTLTFRTPTISHVASIELALVPVPAGNTLEQAYTEQATSFGVGNTRRATTNDCRLDEYPVYDCVTDGGYIAGTVENPSTTCPDSATCNVAGSATSNDNLYGAGPYYGGLCEDDGMGPCEFVPGTAEEAESCSDKSFPNNGVCDMHNGMCSSGDCVPTLLNVHT